MGNALYARLATPADASGAGVVTIPSTDGGTQHGVGGRRRRAPLLLTAAVAAGHPTSRTGTATALAALSHVDYQGVLDARFHLHPQFNKRHASTSTTSDHHVLNSGKGGSMSPDHRGTPELLVAAQHSFFHHALRLQYAFFLFSLYVFHYLSTVRFMFGADSYPRKMAAGLYDAMMVTGDADVPSTKQWMGLLYLACTVGGLCLVAWNVLYMMYENGGFDAVMQVMGVRCSCRRFRGLVGGFFCCCCCSRGGDEDPDDDDDEGSGRDTWRDDTRYEAAPPPRVYLHRPVFLYRSSDRAQQDVLDAHADHHAAYGDEARGVVAPNLAIIFYPFFLALFILDVGIAVDLTSNPSSGGDSAGTGYNSTTGVFHSSSYGAPKVGRGIGVLHGVLLLLGAVNVIVPPRRWYQFRAEAYLAARYY